MDKSKWNASLNERHDDDDDDDDLEALKYEQWSNNYKNWGKSTDLFKKKRLQQVMHIVKQQYQLKHGVIVLNSRFVLYSLCPDGKIVILMIIFNNIFLLSWFIYKWVLV